MTLRKVRIALVGAPEEELDALVSVLTRDGILPTDEWERVDDGRVATMVLSDAQRAYDRARMMRVKVLLNTDVGTRQAQEREIQRRLSNVCEHR